MNLEVIPADTTPEAARIEADVYRQMPSEKRLELAWQMSDSLRALVAAGVRARNPDFDEAQLRLGVIRLWLGEALFRQAFLRERLPP